MSITPQSFLTDILKIHTQRAEIYTQLLNEAQYLNQYGVDQLNHYCKESIPKFQQYSKQIRALETDYKKNFTDNDNFVEKIQNLEQKKFKLVVTFLQSQVAFFMKSCPHNHAAPLQHNNTDDNWKERIFKQYKQDSEEFVLGTDVKVDFGGQSGDGEGLDTQNSAQSDSNLGPQNLPKIKSPSLQDADNTNQTRKVLDCADVHGENDHDEHQKALERAKRAKKIEFLTELANIDEDINDIIEEIRCNLMDLTE
jgi:hypothetical protein